MHLRFQLPYQLHATFARRGKVARAAGPRDARVALLIDGDHVSPGALGSLVKAVARIGVLAAARYYTNETQAAKRAPECRRFGVTTVGVPLIAGGNSSPVDMEIMADAVDFAKDSKRAGVTGIAVASEDIDFVTVLRRARGYGLQAFLVRRALPGIGIPDSVQGAVAAAGGEVIRYSASITYGKVKVVFDRGSSDITVQEDEVIPRHLERAQLEEVHCTLSRCGYLPTMPEQAQAASFISVVALAKFFYVNQLGPLTFFPRWCALQEGYEVIRRHPLTCWARDPGDLVFIEPRGKYSSAAARRLGGTNAAEVASGGGPFLLTVSPALVSAVLQKLGYCAPGGDLAEPARVFCRMNAAALQKRGFQADLRNTSRVKELLHGVFASQGHLQQWRTVPSDGVVRTYLRAHGLLSSVDAPQHEAHSALLHYFCQEGLAPEERDSYHTCVKQLCQHFARSDANRRSSF